MSNVLQVKADQLRLEAVRMVLKEEMVIRDRRCR